MGMAAQAQEVSLEAQNNGGGAGQQPLGPLNEYNITNYMVDASMIGCSNRRGPSI